MILTIYIAYFYSRPYFRPSLRVTLNMMLNEKNNVIVKKNFKRKTTTNSTYALGRHRVLPICIVNKTKPCNIIQIEE